eukprot:Sspe_Gene.54830::Locus_30211_Transcript_1_1_Confidence_1.000_Length_462::g.54830::m.54830
MVDHRTTSTVPSLAMQKALASCPPPGPLGVFGILEWLVVAMPVTYFSLRLFHQHSSSFLHPFFWSMLNFTLALALMLRERRMQPVSMESDSDSDAKKPTSPTVKIYKFAFSRTCGT